MRLDLIQLRRRAAMRWPTMTSFVSAASSTAKPRKPHRNLAEQCRDHMISVILHPADAATASAIRPPNGVASSLCGNHLLLKACQQQLPFGQGQTQTGDIAEIVGPVDRHDVGRLFLTASPFFHQSYNPRHASTPGQRPDTKISLRRSHPQSPGSLHSNILYDAFNSRQTLSMHQVAGRRGAVRTLEGHSGRLGGLDYLSSGLRPDTMTRHSRDPHRWHRRGSRISGVPA